MLPAQVKAVAFGLDDTLTDWFAGIEHAARHVGDHEIVERVRTETWVWRDDVVVNRHHWRALHEPETFMAADPAYRKPDPRAFAPLLDLT